MVDFFLIFFMGQKIYLKKKSFIGAVNWYDAKMGKRRRRKRGSFHVLTH